MVIKKRVGLILTNMLCVAGLFSTRAWADEPEKIETSDQCSEITLEEVPVADLNQELVLPFWARPGAGAELKGTIRSGPIRMFTNRAITVPMLEVNTEQVLSARRKSETCFAARF